MSYKLRCKGCGALARAYFPFGVKSGAKSYVVTKHAKDCRYNKVRRNRVG